MMRPRVLRIALQIQLFEHALRDRANHLQEDSPDSRHLDLSGPLSFPFLSVVSIVFTGVAAEIGFSIPLDKENAWYEPLR
jgi:hypothetical protein